MPDEVSHLVWTYLLLKHPRFKEKKDFKSGWSRLATYFFTFLPDTANLLMIAGGLAVMRYYGLSGNLGPDMRAHPEVMNVFYGPLRNLYYILHSYVTMAALLLVAYVILRRLYWPLLLGMGQAITFDIFTHKDSTALKPLYPLLDVKVGGILHWGSWTFYIIELALIIAYTIWVFRKEKNRINAK